MSELLLLLCLCVVFSWCLVYAVPLVVRPLMHAIGDCRRGQELLDRGQDDMKRYTVSNLRETPEGSRLLANFASMMDERVGMAVRSYELWK